MPQIASPRLWTTAAWFGLSIAHSSLAGTAAIDFNDGSAGQLRDQAGGDGFASGSVWVGDTAKVKVVAGDLNAPAQTGLDLTQAGKSLKVRASHDEERVVNRELASPLGGRVWGTFLIDVPKAGKTGLGFNTPPTHHTFSGQSIVAEPGPAGLDLVYRIGQTEKDRAAAIIQPDTPTLILYRIVYSPSDPDKGFAAWVNPNLLSPLPEPDVFSSAIGNGNIGSLTVGGLGGAEIDMIHLSNDPDAFTDVTGRPLIVVQEPTAGDADAARQRLEFSSRSALTP